MTLFGMCALYLTVGVVVASAACPNMKPTELYGSGGNPSAKKIVQSFVFLYRVFVSTGQVTKWCCGKRDLDVQAISVASRLHRLTSTWASTSGVLTISNHS